MIMVKQNYIDQLINSKSKDLMVLKEVANAWTESSKETLLSWRSNFRISERIQGHKQMDLKH